ncbi:HYC_CC_PP family protein [Mucilaginibacter rubeus]|uniref:HYC_CC_PP family protein n=1 Tax=Mucilaginibacter rubeus TaxID=2027860 RepID=UPI000DCCCC37|nr:hypothetical protein [Mucilaginibacter rubeus]QTE56438.1 hypothetical protein J3L23_30345 [Mucilaginibacter rubeus]QTF62860.1 hypothetical protein J3L20_03170 [Mucilaginibacter rubeus]
MAIFLFFIYICVLKKIISILLVFAYAISVYGVSVNKFYCCGQLSTVSIAKITQLNCPNKSDPSCCKTTKQEFKIKDNHVFAKASSIAHIQFAVVIAEYFIQIPAESIGIKNARAYNSHAPPATRDALYTLFCTYRI